MSVGGLATEMRRCERSRERDGADDIVTYAAVNCGIILGSFFMPRGVEDYAVVHGCGIISGHSLSRAARQDSLPRTPSCVRCDVMHARCTPVAAPARTLNVFGCHLELSLLQLQ
jgi:hypothetical protein